MGNQKNLVLIGMPGAGKSTLGLLAAKALAMPFVDVDVSLQVQEGQALAALLAGRGLAGFCELEGQFIQDLDWRGTVVATGGSAVYHSGAMAHLNASGVVVYLHASVPLLGTRLGDLDRRGVVRAPGQDLAALYAERHPLYCRYADVTVEVDGQSVDAIVGAIQKAYDAVDRSH